MKVKDRFKAAEHSDVPLDYFLFSCHEAENTHRTAKKDNPLTWPSISDVSPEEGYSDQIRDTIQDLLSWYAAQFPQLKAQGVINFGRLTEVTEPVARLAIDIRAIAEKLTGTEFHIGESAENAAHPLHVKLWDALQEFVSQIFRQHQGLYLKYLQWCYETPKSETFELGSRPPVGRFAPPMRSRFGNDRGGGGDRPPRGNDRPPRNNDRGGDRPPRGDRDQGRGGNRDRNQGGGGGRRDFQGDRGPRRDRDRGGRDHNRGGGNNAGTEAAIAEVMDAVQKMRDDTSVNEIALKPANSFNRRLQHEQIKSSGFFSASAGEGHDRAVVIIRAEREGDGE